MIEIQAICPLPTQASAHLRIVSPLAHLRREKGGLRVNYEKNCELYHMMQHDICIMQRPFSNLCVNRAEVAKIAGCKLWIDWDDDYTAMPPTNVSWKYYQFPNLMDNLARLQDLADVITVSTKELEGVFGKHPEKVRIVPNAMEDRWIPDSPPEPKKKVILWRGCGGHELDLVTFRPALIKLAKKFSPEWTFLFLGPDPQLYIHGMPEGSWKHIPEMDYYEMLETMQAISAPIHIVPLADNAFNRSKSNLAYLEATCSGSVVIAPDWEEWKRPGVIPYWSPDFFFVTVEGAIYDMAKAARLGHSISREKNSEAFDYVRTNHALSVVNETRWDIIQNLIN